jgi:Kef-type K+ transport system membrane component KefB
VPRWFALLLLIDIALFVLGTVLIGLSGRSGDQPGGSQLVWQAGGVMVYLSFALFAVAILLALGRLLWSAGRLVKRTSHRRIG